MFHRCAIGLSDPSLKNAQECVRLIMQAATFVLLPILLGSTSRARADDWTTLWTTAKLSQPREHLAAAAAAGGKVFFAGGENYGYSSDVVDIYDMATGVWSVSKLSKARDTLSATSVGNKVFFGGGNEMSGGTIMTFLDTVDIFDTDTDSWSTATLSQERTNTCATSVNGMVFFAGGYSSMSALSSVVDIYNAATDMWSTASLSEARGSLSATSSGGLVYFGGGRGSGNSNRVDIFDTSTDTWSTASLSLARRGLAAASASGKVLFGGGYNGNYVDTVDIFDTATGIKTTATLSQGRAFLAAASVGNKVLFAGGNSRNPSMFHNAVDIYDAATGVWSTATLSQARNNLTATSSGNKVFFAGGNHTGFSPRSDVVDIYTLQSYSSITSCQTWTLEDTTTVAGRMQLNACASLSLDSYDLAVGSMSGVAPVDLSTQTLTVGNDNTDSTYSGAITGNGTLTKTGSGVLTLSGTNSYLGLTTISAGELDLVGPDAWYPVTNLDGAYLLGGELVFDYSGSVDPYEMILSLLDTKISGAMPLTVLDNTVNERIVVSLVPEPSTLLLAVTGLLGMLIQMRRRKLKA